MASLISHMESEFILKSLCCSWNRRILWERGCAQQHSIEQCLKIGRAWALSDGLGRPLGITCLSRVFFNVHTLLHIHMYINYHLLIINYCLLICLILLSIGL
jgi:hypothetical protein